MRQTDRTLVIADLGGERPVALRFGPEGRRRKRNGQTPEPSSHSIDQFVR